MRQPWCRTLTLLAFACTMISNNSSAQQPATGDDVSSNPMFQMFQMHFDSKVKAFRSESNNMGTVVLLGDSITEGFDVTKWFPFRRVLNRGIGADVIGVGQRKGDRRGLLKRMDVSVFDCCTSHVFLLIGVNDLGDGRPLDVMVTGYRQILEQIRARAPGVTVHVQSLLPTSRGFVKHKENILKLNEELQKLATEFGYPYVDLHARLRNDNGDLKDEFTSDGLHINDKAYAVWKGEIEREMGW